MAAFRGDMLKSVMARLVEHGRNGALTPADAAYLAPRISATLLEKHHARNRGSLQSVFTDQVARKAREYVSEFFKRRGGVFRRPER